MMNRYIDALIRLLRIDRMARSDASCLSMQLQSSAASNRRGSIHSRAGSAKQTTAMARGRSYSDDQPTVSFADTKSRIDGMFMCSLLPDGRDARIEFVEAVEPLRRLASDRKRIKGLALTSGPVDHFPESIDVNEPANRVGLAPGSARASFRRHHSIAASGPMIARRSPSPPNALEAPSSRTTNTGKPSRDIRPSLPEIRKKNSVLTIDVNHGAGIFVPLNRSASAEMPSTEISGMVRPQPTPPPPREKSAPTGSNRPGVSRLATIPPANRSGIFEAAENVMGTASILKLVDATAVLADRLGSPEQVKSPRQNIMVGTAPNTSSKKRSKKTKKGKAITTIRLKPTAGDIARLMREAIKSKARRAETARSISDGGGNDSSPERGASRAATTTATNAISSIELNKKWDYLDTNEYNADDVVLVLNVRVEGTEGNIRML